MSTTTTTARPVGTALKAVNLVETEVSYVKYDPKHEHEKPYTVNYDTAGAFPRTNVVNDPKPILVQNFRPLQDSKNFEEYGFSTAKICSTLAPHEFDDARKVEAVFYPEIQELLSKQFPGAAKIEVLEHQIRKRHPTFPVATGQPYQYLPPTTLVHIDYTPESSKRTSRAAFRESSERYQRLLTLNVWKSLQGSGNDWPLALCDKRTIDHDSESIAQDIVWEDRFSENARVYYSTKHKWYYMEDLKDNEVILFQQSDSDVEGRGGVPHTGFFNPNASRDAAPRESIELRAFLYFK